MEVSESSDIHSLSFFSLLTEEQAEQVVLNSNVVVYNKKATIFMQNTRTSHVMFVKSGLVKVSKEGKSGRSIFLKVVKPNSFLGLISVFGQDTHQFSASAIESSEVLFIDISVFKQIIKDNGAFAIRVINMISLEGLFIFDRLLGQAQKQLPGRIADVLLYFSEEIYGSSSFSFPVTRRELAELAGTTKESFIRTLTEFKNDKIIELEGSDVNIVSMKIVKTLSNIG